MATVQSLSDRLRAELGDTARSFVETFSGDGIAKRFQLTQAPVQGSTVVVKVGTVNVSSTTVIEEGTGIFTLATAPISGAVITLSGVAYRYFTDSEIAYYIETAFTEHTTTTLDRNGNKVSLVSLATLDEYPLVVLAASYALVTLATDASFDIDIIAPDGVSIPRSERYRQLMETVQQRKEQYRELCTMLGIGLYKIEMGTLRRVSRHTNKYVPIYINQEIDDYRKPERVYLPTTVMGHTPLTTTAGMYDIELYQGDSWSGEFEFPFDISQLEFKAQIRTYPNSPAIYATFDITIIDAGNGRIRLELDRDATKRLPVRAWWDLQATSPDDTDFEQTYVRGQVITSQQITE